MALLWSAMQSLTWLLLQLLELAAYLTPTAAFLVTLTAIMIVLTMTTQALEHGVLTSVRRSKWHSTLSFDDLRRDFYCGFWLVTLFYVLASVTWIYFTDRGSNRYVYGSIFCILWWGVQLAVVVALTPMDAAIARMKTALKRTRVVAWR
ncbi:unnamed protein product [Hyaloperonospora brassicae]|uniref:Uncharacterized protein n=1 Tax=Hyaloperonospora brassicae TaxID=162125 RepID=A0AAV0UIR2_HYABA|nr:unnamed protein product [Hyaloperonospora brassicae]